MNVVQALGVDAPAHDVARSLILDAAAEAFNRDGYTATTVDDIAEEIGATKGRIYYYFRSKFDVFLGVYQRGMEMARAAVEPQSAGPGSGRERLVAMSSAHTHNLMTHLSYHNSIHQGVNQPSSLALKSRQVEMLNELNGIREDYETMFRGVIVEGIDDGSLRPGDPHLMARMLLSSLNSVDAWFRTRPEQTEEEIDVLAAQVVDFLIDGLSSRG